MFTCTGNHLRFFFTRSQIYFSRNDNLTNLRSFNGSISWYKEFIGNSSHINVATVVFVFWISKSEYPFRERVLYIEQRANCDGEILGICYKENKKYEHSIYFDNFKLLI